MSDDGGRGAVVMMFHKIGNFCWDFHNIMNGLLCTVRMWWVVDNAAPRCTSYCARKIISIVARSEQALVSEHHVTLELIFLAPREVCTALSTNLLLSIFFFFFFFFWFWFNDAFSLNQFITSCLRWWQLISSKPLWYYIVIPSHFPSMKLNLQ